MAQLGARFHGMEEVEGSSPSRSTNFFNNLAVGPWIEDSGFFAYETRCCAAGNAEGSFRRTR